MDPHLFDQISKVFAQRRLSRRALSERAVSLAAAGIASVAMGTAAAAGAEGRSPDTAAPAQSATKTGAFTLLEAPAPATTAIATPIATEPKPTTFLFLQSFEAGSLVPKAGAPGRYTLTLKRGLGDTIYFSDRPAKVVGTVPTDQFLQALGFTPANPPNAALVGHRDATHKDVVVVELFDPHYDAAANTLTYEVSLLADWRKLGETFEETPDDAAQLPRDFTAAHLFIDDCPDMQYICVNGTSDITHTLYRGSCWLWVPPGCYACEDYTPQCYTTYPDFCKNGCALTRCTGLGGGYC